MGSVHAKKPVRSVIAAQAVYTAYRDDLRKDFNGCCGYCDDADERVDRLLFHIDHFAPKTKFPLLRTHYPNLVYACRFCNVCKSSHWVGDDATVANDGRAGFVDPCAADYDDHVERDSSGRIVSKTELGAYIVRRLKLNLACHELLWKARRSRVLRAEVLDLRERLRIADPQRVDPRHLDLADTYIALTTAIDAYELAAVTP